MADHASPAVASPQTHGVHGHDEHGHEDIMLVGHDGQLHPAHLQHHFVSAQQQFESSKLGMWLFLVTEILLFGGMFVAYAIFRAWYPELYAEASTQLDTVMGAINTLVLLASSLTVAWAIRGAQTDNQKVLFWNLVATVALAGCFMVVKYFEYTHKFELGIFPGKHFVIEEDAPEAIGETTAALTLEMEETEAGDEGPVAEAGEAPAAELVTPPAEAAGDEEGAALAADGDPAQAEDAAAVEDDEAFVPPAEGAHAAEGTHAAADDHGAHAREGAIFHDRRAGLFFSIYYVMTGIHGLHVLIGMIAISILAVKARRGRYSSVYYTPVENVGLYWHVVDVIWIFLFPLMYLI